MLAGVTQYCLLLGSTSYTTSIVGFVVVVLLLVVAIGAIFTACICYGPCKSRHPLTRGQRPSILPLPTSNHGNTLATNQNSMTSPRQPPPSSRSVRSFRPFPPPSALAPAQPAPPTTVDSTSSPRPSNTLRAAVHLAQLPPLSAQDRHTFSFTRRPSLPHYSSTPSHTHATPTNKHQRFCYQMSISPERTGALQGRLKVRPDATPGAGGGAGIMCRTPVSAGIIPSSLNFPSPMIALNAGHTHSSPKQHCKTLVGEDTEVEMDDKEMETDDFPSSSSHSDFHPSSAQHIPVEAQPGGVVREPAPLQDCLHTTTSV